MAAGLARATENVRELSKELSSTPPKEGVPTLPRQPSRTQKSAPPPATVDRPVPVEVVEPPPNAFQSFRNILGPLLLPLGKVLIVAVFTIVMLIKREDLRSRVLRLFGLEKLNLVTQAFDDASDRVMRYLRMQFLVNAVFGSLIALGLHVHRNSQRFALGRDRRTDALHPVRRTGDRREPSPDRVRWPSSRAGHSRWKRGSCSSRSN